MTRRDHASSDLEYGLMRELLEPLAQVTARLEAGAEQLPLFFLVLDPWSWSVRFVQPSGPGDAILAQELLELIEPMRPLYSDVAPANVHSLLARHTVELLEHFSQKKQPKAVHLAAIDILETHPLALGFGTDLNASNWLAPGRTPKITSAKPDKHTLIRFQDALDFGATADSFRHSLKLLHERSKENRYYRNYGPCTLQVPAYTSRKNLVTPRNVHIFLAEYIYYGGTLRSVKPRQPIDFYFLPLRGFGQWRACIDWLASEAAKPPALTGPSRRLLEEFYSVFLCNLVAALLERHPIEPEGVTMKDAWRAFVHLYWADAIDFWCAGKRVRTLDRSPTGVLQLVIRARRPLSPRPNSKGLAPFLHFEPVRSLSSRLTEAWLVTLDLRAIGSVIPRAEPRIADQIATVLGFERVVYMCRLIDGEECVRACGQWEAILAEKIYKVVETRLSSIEMLSLRRSRELMQTFDMILHTGLSTLRSIASDIACRDFADGIPPTQLRYQLVPHKEYVPEHIRDLPREQKLLDTLRRVWVGEAATAGALAFGRILANGGIVPEKLRAPAPYSLAEAVERAEFLLRGYDQSEGRVGFSLESDHELGLVEFPAGYLAKEHLANIFFELFLNGYRHSSQRPICLRVEVERGPGCVHAAVLSCLGQRGESLVWRTERGIAHRRGSAGGGTFLFRLKDICELIKGGLDIATSLVERAGSEWYKARLSLGSLDK
jgi:hypothetical protein